MRESKRERIKLTANYQNGLAVSVFAVGAFAPFYNTAAHGFSELITKLVLFVMITLLSYSFHMRGRRQLNELDEPKSEPDPKDPADLPDKFILFFGLAILLVFCIYNLSIFILKS